MSQDQFKVGQWVVSRGVGGRPEFTGRIASIYESGRFARLAVIQDAQGLSWLRELHELSPAELEPA
jgi:hypothetical protein